MVQFENSLDFAKGLDAKDELASTRHKFIIPKKNGEEQIYFLGNSLGLQPGSTSRHIHDVLEQWGTYGVEGFFHGQSPWMEYHESLLKTLSEIVGALQHEVVAMNQLTTNLHLLLVSFYQPRGKRNKILCEAKAFPSDQYMFETHLKHLGLDPESIIIEVSPRAGEENIRIDDIVETITIHKDELALVLMGGVNYYTGQLFDIQTITSAAHQAGAIAGYDLAHAAGNVPLSLHDWGVDFACWCSYKYLNSGPGAIGGVYIHERFHNNMTIHRFGGWWGHDKETRFQMEKGFVPITSAEGWQLSTPSIILFACHKASLDIFEEVGIKKLFEKGRILTNYLVFILNQINQQRNSRLFKILTPQNESERGRQVSILTLKEGRKIFKELSVKGVFADWREPDVIRIAPVPLYNSFEEVWKFGEIVRSLQV